MPIEFTNVVLYRREKVHPVFDFALRIHDVRAYTHIRDLTRIIIVHAENAEEVIAAINHEMLHIVLHHIGEDTKTNEDLDRVSNLQAWRRHPPIGGL